MNLRNKLFLIIFSISLVTFLVPTISMYILERHQITTYTVDKLKAILRSKTYALQEQKSHLDHGLALIGSRIQLKESIKRYHETGDENYLRLVEQDLDEVMRSAQGICNIKILNLEGDIIASTKRSRPMKVLAGMVSYPQIGRPLV